MMITKLKFKKLYFYCMFALDAILTYIGISDGVVKEINPIFFYTIDLIGLYLACIFKVFIGGICADIIFDNDVTKYIRYAQNLLNALITIVVLSNIWVVFL